MNGTSTSGWEKKQARLVFSFELTFILIPCKLIPNATMNTIEFTGLYCDNECC